VIITINDGGAADTTAPAAVSDLSEGSATSSSITLSWTSPGDNGSTGIATQYDIRYSTSTITSGNWDAATQLTGVPAPLVAGTTQNRTVTGLSANTTYYFALKTADEVPNWSGISNSPDENTSSESGSYETEEFEYDDLDRRWVVCYFVFIRQNISYHPIFLSRFWIPSM
jgi:hypothetical protein